MIVCSCSILSCTMGQNTSHHSGRKWSKSISRTPSLKESIVKRCTKTHNKNLSATFNILDPDLQWDLLNVNLATEEELMTLPGVSRTIARNIVEYRQTIHGFKKVEDLALVSGVGASKLEVFRSEVTVNSRKKLGGSRSSSRNHSMESIPNSESSFRASRPVVSKIVNVNTANVFQLMSVRGISQELAASILDYRERKGPFKSISDLLKVKGMSSTKLSSVKFYLSVDHMRLGRLPTCSSFSNGPRTSSSFAKLPQHKRSKSDPAFSSPLQTPDNLLQEVFNILSAHSIRPIIEDVFCGARNGRTALRIGTWNLQDFTTEKGNNPGVREVICRTVLENGLNLVALHEIVSWDSLSSIVSELNNPQLSKVKSWDGTRGKWKISKDFGCSLDESDCSSRYQSVFLYNSCDDLCLSDVCLQPLTLVSKSESNNRVGSLIGHFQANELSFVVVCVCLQEEFDADAVSVMVEMLKESYQDEVNTLVISEACHHTAQKNVDGDSCSGYTELLSSMQLNSKLHHTRVLLSNSLENSYTGHSGVIREGLRHLAIPDGWSWGGAVSKSIPVWVELYSEQEKSPLTNGICNESADSAESSP